MKSKHLGLLALTLIGILIYSCQNDNIEEAEITNYSINKTNGNVDYNIPYTNESTLSQFNSDNDIVNYNLARKIALLELDGTGFREELNWEGHTLSELPVLIYGFDSKPKYYEFIVKDAENIEVGSVTVEARKMSGAIINDLRKNIRDYNALYSKSDSGMQLMRDWSGKVYMGLIGKSGDEPTTVIDPSTGEAVVGMEELTDEEILEEITESIESQPSEEETFQSIQEYDIDIDLSEIAKPDIEIQKDSLALQMEIAHQERDAYWEAIDEYSDEIMASTDQEIVEKSSKFFGFLGSLLGSIFSGSSGNSKYEISRYASNLNYLDHVSDDWCGPWAMDWIYETNYGSSKYSFFESMASSIHPLGFIIKAVSGEKPMFPIEMFVSMVVASHGKTIIQPWFTYGRKNAYNHIRNNDNPVIILTEWGSHWKVGYGCYRTGSWFWYNYYFACQDNGYLDISKTNTYMKASWFMMSLKVRE